MSWPTDGEPRFVVRELEGYRIGRIDAKTGSGSVTGLSVMVMDRAYNHRVVSEHATEDVTWTAMPRSQKVALVRERAQHDAARLNALAR